MVGWYVLGLMNHKGCFGWKQAGGLAIRQARQIILLVPPVDVTTPENPYKPLFTSGLMMLKEARPWN